MVDMTITEEAVGDLRFIASEIAKADTNLAKYQQMRDDAIRAYAAEGATLRELADAAGISFQRVGQIAGKPAIEKPEGCLFECDTLSNGQTFHNEECPNAVTA